MTFLLLVGAASARADGPFAYVANFGASSISVIDTSGPYVVSTILAFQPQALALSPDNRYLYVANSYNYVAVVDTRANSVISYIYLLYSGQADKDIAVSRDGIVGIVSDGSFLDQLDLDSNQLAASYFVTRNPGLAGVAISQSETASESTFYVTNQDANLLASLPPGRTRMLTAVGAGPVDVVASQAFVYVAEQNAESVSILRVADGSTVATIDVGSPLIAITADFERNKVYALHRAGIAVIDTADNVAVGNIPIVELQVPSGIAILPDGVTAYVTDAGRDVVAVVDLTHPENTPQAVHVGEAPEAVAAASGPIDLYTPTPTPSQVPSGCCQCDTFCSVPEGGGCPQDCTLILDTICDDGACRESTPTPTGAPPQTQTPTGSPTKTPTLGANDCCECADTCAVPVDGSCPSECSPVSDASCFADHCTTSTPTPFPGTPLPCGQEAAGTLFSDEESEYAFTLGEPRTVAVQLTPPDVSSSAPLRMTLNGPSGSYYSSCSGLFGPAALAAGSYSLSVRNGGCGPFDTGDAVSYLLWLNLLSDGATHCGSLLPCQGSNLTAIARPGEIRQFALPATSGGLSVHVAKEIPDNQLFEMRLFNPGGTELDSNSPECGTEASFTVVPSSDGLYTLLINGCSASETGTLDIEWNSPNCPVALPCTGDCNGDNGVTVEETVRMVATLLGKPVHGSCSTSPPSIDPAQVLAAVESALSGCD